MIERPSAISHQPSAVSHQPPESSGRATAGQRGPAEDGTDTSAATQPDRLSQAARRLEDAARFVEDGLVDAERFRALVAAIPDESYRSSPNLSRAMVESAVEDFLSSR